MGDLFSWAAAKPAPRHWLRVLLSEIDRGVFQDWVSRSVQNDGQRVLDAAQDGNRAVLVALHVKYLSDVGRSLGGGGAGPGKVKKPRPGAAAVGKLALWAADQIGEG